MNRKTVFWLSILATGITLKATAQDKKDTAGNVKPDTAKVEKTSYEKLLKDPQKSVKGLMNLYYVKNKLYMEVPLNLMDKDMLLASTISEISDNYDGIVGSKPTDPLMVRFSLVDSTVLLRKVERKMIASESDKNILSALEKNSIGAIMKIFTVSAFNKERTTAVIDITDYFLSDVKDLSPFGAFSMYKSQGITGTQSFKKDRSFIGEIKSFKDNVLIKSHLSYENTLTDGKRTLARDRPFTVVMTRTFLLLSDDIARPRIADSRIGIFTTEKYKLSNEVNKTERLYFANRWRLEPRDKEAYKRGELVDPVKPIVFYIDSDFPESWKKTIRDAVNEWQITFREIGFKNAILALDYPENDPEFDPDNLKFNCIRYAPTPVANAIGPSWVDPRTGEIINASVYIFHDVVKLLNNWMFIQTSPADKLVRNVELPEAYKLEGIKYVVRHEVGHCLGFMHNMGASSSIPVDSLLSPSFTQKYGTTYSIMDYARFNYIAQPGDKERGVKLSPPTFGLYDYFLVKWNYTYYDKTSVSPLEEKSRLAKMIAEKAGDIRYRYGAQQGIAFDPSSQNEDLGDDAVKASVYGIKNLRYIMANLNEWVGGQDKDYTYRQAVWDGILTQYVRYINHVYANVGGMYLHEKYVGDPRPFFESVPRKKQAEAVQFMLNELLTLDWLEDKKVLENMTLTGTPSTVLRNQIVEALLMAPLKVNLSAIKSKEKNPYTSEDVMNDLYAAVWNKTLKNEVPSKAEREMQKAYVKNIIKSTKLITSSSPAAFAATTASSFAIALPEFVKHREMDGCLCDLSDKHADAFDPVSAFGGGSVQFNIQPSLEPIYFIHLMNSKKLLEKGIKKTSDKETSMHYKLLLNQIDKVLK